MRIPTYVNSHLQAERLNRQYDLMTRLQMQISSGKKLIDSSDDPVLASTIKATKDYMSYLDTYKNNLTLGQSRSKIMEDSVTGSINAMTRAAALVKEAQSDTKNNSDRLNIATELEGILNTMTSYVNTRDATGNYIFSGTNAQATSFAMVNGTYQYLGSQEQTSINVSPSTSVIYNENGQAVFGDMFQGNGVAVISQGATPNTGTAETSVATITNSTAYNSDTYTLQFVTNSAGQLAYQVTGVSSGQVIPAPPQTVPADAPAYQAGSAITVNGVNFTITGQPNVGDSFKIAPSQKQNVLETLRQTINLLKTPINNDVDKAAFHQQIDELSASINGGNAHLTKYLSEVGYREKELDNENAINSADMLSQKILLSKYESADPYELISDFKENMNSLQLTQEVQTKLQDFFEELLKNVV